MKKSLIVIGPPVCGKSSLARALTLRHGFAHYEMSRMLSALGDPNVDRVMSEGGLVDSSTVNQLLLRDLRGKRTDEVRILNGAARNLSQLRVVDAVIDSQKNTDRAVVLFTNLSFEAALERNMRAKDRGQRSDDKSKRKLAGRFKHYFAGLEEMIDEIDSRSPIVVDCGLGLKPADVLRFVEEALGLPDVTSVPHGEERVPQPVGG